MKKITPLRDVVLGRMIDTFGIKTTGSGLIFQEQEGTEASLRPRWFEVVAVGPEQTDIKEGDFVLVPNGRWTRGLDVYRTSRKEEYIFGIDVEAALAVTNENPLE